MWFVIEKSVPKHPRNSDAEFIENIRNMWPKWSPNPSVDTERHRRTPRLLATSGKAICPWLWALAEADSMRHAGRYWRCCKIFSNWPANSIRNRWNIRRRFAHADCVLSRMWNLLLYRALTHFLWWVILLISELVKRLDHELVIIIRIELIWCGSAWPPSPDAMHEWIAKHCTCWSAVKNPRSYVKTR